MKGIYNFLFWTLAVTLTVVKCDDSPKVIVPGLGTIIGLSPSYTSFTKRTYYPFLGIPYAKPITQETRFQPSLPADPFTQSYYATDYGSDCWQSVSIHANDAVKNSRKRMGRQVSNGDPNKCLILDIYTPKLPSETSKSQTQSQNLLPVIVFIHGGGFDTGMAWLYQPDRMLEEDIVLVAIQYRLGPQGFLCMQVPEIPGNAGLYDQDLALKWVRDHISSFGGDPSRVTINGQSAGSASVSLLALSNYSNYLFNNVIAESGSALVPWAVDIDPVGHALGFASLVGCKSEDHSEVAKCLLRHSDEELAHYYEVFQHQMWKAGDLGFGATIPCVQEVSPANHAKILDKHPIDIFKDTERQKRLRELKFIFGSTKTEGSYIMGIMYFNFLKINNLLDNHTFLMDTFGPTFLKTVGITDPTYSVANSLAEDYLIPGSQGNATAMFPGLIDLMGVFFMKGGCYRTMQLHAELSDSYWYSFEYEGTNSKIFWDMQFGNGAPFPPGVTHGEDLLYLYLPQLEFPIKGDEILLSKKMVKMWANFATYRNPTPENVHDSNLTLPIWPAYSFDNPAFLRMLSPNNFTVDTNYPHLWHITRDENIAKTTSTIS